MRPLSHNLSDGLSRVLLLGFLSFPTLIAPLASVASSVSNKSSVSVSAIYNGNKGFASSTSKAISLSVIACDNSSIVTTTIDDGSVGTLRYAISNVCAGGTVDATGVTGIIQRNSSATKGQPKPSD